MKWRDLVWPAGGMCSSTNRTDYAPRVRFSATPGEEPEVEVALV
jgi:hypothetical protein